MSIQQQLQEDMKNAMRNKEQQRLDTIRMMLASLKNAQIDLRRELDEVEAVGVIQKEAKRRRDAMAEYTKANRPDLAASEEVELVMIEAYLPTMLSADQLRPEIAAIIAELGATSIADLSKVMPAAMQRFKGKAEGRVINEVVRSLLSA
ncbi:MAG TPA: GatB/YqeY domain-containing protein [Herpetosiphon sp.]|uniref:GatB/YqeY domain protein n=1 Tax=Herpetosiphon aurantiacus (strain ATCC 23779 / DSM 785 / 114-95) TaxID=316274 RepID=A9B120_HERA2|nr:GatB/YqeY domain-containing protein [Herpetosiphon sp.]ABX05298.1 GatB/YqeY domain protein [Herpetosiphon aurantiacus DSM 785]MCA0351385.1 GatB/YqeY domain-containing protein [Chloroflexota bacterium]HBW51193.1 GatB/YqeY domain-containing protein [Herpetosiphon sp.]